jgi:hypothetical protein
MGKKGVEISLAALDQPPRYQFRFPKVSKIFKHLRESRTTHFILTAFYGPKIIFHSGIRAI